MYLVLYYYERRRCDMMITRKVLGDQVVKEFLKFSKNKQHSSPIAFAARFINRNIDNGSKVDLSKLNKIR